MSKVGGENGFPPFVNMNQSEKSSAGGVGNVSERLVCGLAPHVHPGVSGTQCRTRRGRAVTVSHSEHLGWTGKVSVPEGRLSGRGSTVLQHSGAAEEPGPGGILPFDCAQTSAPSAVTPAWASPAPG